MEIFFDRKTTKVLRYIRNHPHTSLNLIQSKFGDVADSYLIMLLCQAGYVVCVRADGRYTMFDDPKDRFFYGEETFWVSPKGRKLLEDRFDHIWQWAIPTAISVAALIVSVLAIIYS